MSPSPENHAANLLEVRGLACEKGFQTLFSELDFTAGPATVTQICGVNGSGKTSLLRILSTFGLAAAGTVDWNGVAIGRQLAEYRASIAFLGHKNGLKPDLTPMENIQAAAAIGGFSASTAANRIAKRLLEFEIGPRQQRPCRQLSAGQQQRVAIARMTLSPAPLWLMDEPATALDQEGIDMLSRLMASHLAEDGIIIFSSHQSFRFDGAAVTEVWLGRQENDR